MATTTHINGSSINLYLNGVGIARSTNCSLKITHNVIETTVKESGGWFDGISGLRSASLSVEGAVYYVAGGMRHVDMVSNIISRATLGWAMRSSVAGDYVYFGSAIVTDTETSNPVEDQATFSAELTVVGAITIGTV